MSLDVEGTILVLAGVGIPLYSARGLTQSLDPIGAAAFTARTINGELMDLSAAQFRKYKSTISGTDQRPPAVDGKWPGQIVTVDCVAELAYLTSSGSPARPVVSGSSHTEGAFTLYRPQLVMMILGFTMAKEEWAANVPWQIDLEEI